MENLVAGIDIGGTSTKFGIVGRDGHLYGEGAISTERHQDFVSFVKQLSLSLREMLTDYDQGAGIRGIGVGAPNGNYYNGCIEYAPNLNWKGIIPISRQLNDLFKVPVALTNDANAAAIGEMMYGAAGGMKDFIVITLGTGLGSGIVSNGNLVYGHDGFAGEMGHITAFENGRLCGCGRRGCLETYVSATGIRKTVLEILERGSEDSILRSISSDEMTAKMISGAAEKGDRLALEAFEFTGELLGRKLADVVALLSPEAVFLLGGLANAGELLFKPVKAHMEKNLLPVFCDKVKILPSGLSQNTAAILGAAGLIWKEITP